MAKRFFQKEENLWSVRAWLTALWTGLNNLSPDSIFRDTFAFSRHGHKIPKQVGRYNTSSFSIISAIILAILQKSDDTVGLLIYVIHRFSSKNV